ncbi:MAG TPA: toll/interleukin-1 receptor domain-containing protein [Anaerolineales bacterium]|nr:toll/interleukin-1 receptor domain-containing protein [Anaerolineales bacterium]
MRDVFISHVEEDETIALQIAQGLEAAGYTTWYYERDSIPGVSYLLHTRQAIEQSQVIILIISPHSLGSQQVTREVVRAHESSKYFIPVLRNVSHLEFQKRQPEWEEAIGAATSIRLPVEGAAAILPRIIAGLKALGIDPSGNSSLPAQEEILKYSPYDVHGPDKLASQKIPAWQQTVSWVIRKGWWLGIAGLVIMVLVLLRIGVFGSSLESTKIPTFLPISASSTMFVALPDRSPIPMPTITYSAAAPRKLINTPTPLQTMASTLITLPADALTGLPIQGYGLPYPEPFDVVYDSILRVLFDDRLVSLNLVEAEGRFRALEQQDSFNDYNSLFWDDTRDLYWAVLGSPWMVSDEIDLVDRSGLTVVAFIIPEASCNDPKFVAWDGEYLWVTSAGVTLCRFRPLADMSELSLVDTYAPSLGKFPNTEPSGLTWDGEYLWVLVDDILNKLDRTGQRICKIEMASANPQPTWYGWKGVAWDGQYLWVAHSEQNELYRVDSNLCQ